MGKNGPEYSRHMIKTAPGKLVDNECDDKHYQIKYFMIFE